MQSTLNIYTKTTIKVYRMDVHSPEQRSYNMSRIKSKNTKPELLVRKWLWSRGYRYSLHSKDLPGRPDIVFSKMKKVVFVHGCFWHGHGCRYSKIPLTNTEYWIEKIARNTERDRRVQRLLEDSGWEVLTVWECELRKNRELTLEKVVSFLSE